MSCAGKGSVASCQEICKPFHLMCKSQRNTNTPDETCPTVPPPHTHTQERNNKSHPVIYQSLCYLKGVTGFYLAPDISSSFVAASQVACAQDETTTYLCVTNLLPLAAHPSLHLSVLFSSLAISVLDVSPPLLTNCRRARINVLLAVGPNCTWLRFQM